MNGSLVLLFFLEKFLKNVSDHLLPPFLVLEIQLYRCRVFLVKNSLHMFSQVPIKEETVEEGSSRGRKELG
jgi:hypothetical protein